MSWLNPAPTKATTVAITIDADADEPRCCCVCTEPLEWVAVGPCGHRDVCAGCATRIRFFAGDWRCCICRTPCPTVVVTKAADGGGARNRGFYYYHAPTGARFDSRSQYRKAVKITCAKPPCPPAANGGAAAAAVNNNLGAPSSSQPAGVTVKLDAPRAPPVEEACLPCAVFFISIYLSVIMILVTMFGLFFKVSENYHQKVATVVVFCLFSAGATIFAIWSWVRFKGHLNSDA